MLLTHFAEEGKQDLEKERGNRQKTFNPALGFKGVGDGAEIIGVVLRQHRVDREHTGVVGCVHGSRESVRDVGRSIVFLF